MQNLFLIFIVPPGSVSSFIYVQSEFGARTESLGVWRRGAVLLPGAAGWAGTGAPQRSSEEGTPTAWHGGAAAVDTHSRDETKRLCRAAP